ncbi:hypothetical protein [uncultured Campylobacter sp.]|jgi:hypothetical protein|uniref:antitoxin n=1 Tax=uncultured Campylobacter sp. TaxID=218934 RepID=UPI00261B203B|nr:hypothetical protein [uncultured Campylobacter sp.]
MKVKAANDKTLKVFKSGNSLALRIPKYLNLEGVKELAIKELSDTEITLSIPKRSGEWDGLLATLAKFKNAEIKRGKQIPSEREFGFDK